MLERTQAKLQRGYDNEPMLGSDGQLHKMDGVTRINMRQCERLAELHKAIRPDLSVEIGLAYGFSSLPILDAMEAHGYGHHIAIDPGQEGYWHGVALVAIEELGFSQRFTWMESRSDAALPKLIAERKRAQFIFFDGLHYFDSLLTDIFLADQILDIGGVLVINDMWLPGIRAIVSYVETNMDNYEPLPAEHENIFVVKKTRVAERVWNHFVPFDGTGSKKGKQSLFGKLFGGQA